MSLSLNRSIVSIELDLQQSGTASFKVRRDSGSTLADVVLAGNAGGHRFEMQATINHHNRERLQGTSTLYLRGELTELVLGSAFGTAYARAVDEAQTNKLTFEQMNRLAEAVATGTNVLETIRDVTNNEMTVSQDDAVMQKLLSRSSASYATIAELATAIASGRQDSVMSAVQRLTGNRLTLGEDQTLARRLLATRRAITVSDDHSTLSGPIAVGDFVQVATSDGSYRGLVVDCLTSRRSNEAVSYLIQRADGEVAALASEVTLVAKG